MSLSRSPEPDYGSRERESARGWRRSGGASRRPAAAARDHAFRLGGAGAMESIPRSRSRGDDTSRCFGIASGPPGARGSRSTPRQSRRGNRPAVCSLRCTCCRLHVKGRRRALCRPVRRRQAVGRDLHLAMAGRSDGMHDASGTAHWDVLVRVESASLNKACMARGRIGGKAGMRKEQSGFECVSE